MKHLLFAILPFALFGCVTYKPAVKREIVKTTTINKDFDKTWSSIVKVFSEKNITFKTMDKASGIVATDEKKFDPFQNGGYIDCGQRSGNSISLDNGRVIYNVFAEKDGKNTKVTLNMRPILVQTINAGFGPQTSETECFSTGTFEKEFFDLIK